MHWNLRWVFDVLRQKLAQCDIYRPLTTPFSIELPNTKQKPNELVRTKQISWSVLHYMGIQFNKHQHLDARTPWPVCPKWVHVWNKPNNFVGDRAKKLQNDVVIKIWFQTKLNALFWWGGKMHWENQKWTVKFAVLIASVHGIFSFAYPHTHNICCTHCKTLFRIVYQNRNAIEGL